MSFWSGFRRDSIYFAGSECSCRQAAAIHTRLMTARQGHSTLLIGGISRNINEKPVQIYHYEKHASVTTHRQDFVYADRFAKRLKTVKELTSYEYPCKEWTTVSLSDVPPTHQISGLNI